MPLRIVRNDIALMECDAIVNPTNTQLFATGSTDARIHDAAGPEMDDACAALGGCSVGEAKCTPGFRLPCRYVFHTVGPMWMDGTQHEPELLASCYRACLRLAEEYSCASVAFPIISAGTFQFPKDLALEIATRELSRYLLHHDLTVYLVVYNYELFQISKRLFSDVESFIGEHYTPVVHGFPAMSYENAMNLPPPASAYGAQRPAGRRRARKPQPFAEQSAVRPSPAEAEERPMVSFSMAGGLEERLAHLDESFTQMLLRKIDERGIKDSDCYKRANVDRKLFSKIRNDPFYRPKKTTVLAFAIALEMPMEETRDFLRKAGYALSNSNKFDVIIEYFIQNRNYNIFEINETLFYFDQSLLGA